MSNAPFPIDPVLTGIALAYKNRRYIADEVLPRISPPLSKEEFKYLLYTKAEGFTIPDTKVGRKSQPNEVEFSATEQTSKTQDYGLEDAIPQNDILNAPQGYDPRAHATESLADLIALDREKRAADLVFTAANYPSGNKVTLSGSTQWSHADSTPIADVMAALDAPLMRPNIMVIGRAAFTKLAQHAHIVKAIHRNDGGSGVARRQDIAELFELDEVIVGESFYNTAKKGQTATMARVWGKHAALLYRDRLAQGTNGRITFGATFQFGTRVAGSMPDAKIGLRGGERVRVGEGVKEIILASDCGYFFEAAVA